MPARPVRRPVRGLPPGSLAALGRRPDLWATAVRTALRLAPPGWWRRPPFLPLPSRRYLHFRMVTAYGGDGDPARGSAGDLVSYLAWCRAWPSVAGAAHTAGLPPTPGDAGGLPPA